MRRGAFLALLAASAPALADKSGEEVYHEACAVCHAQKFDKAPQIGDRAAWAPLMQEGQEVLTAHAWVGVRNMPPRGGKDDLELEEFGRAVAYMARQAGGNWQDPDDVVLEKIRAEVKKRLEDLEHEKK